MMRIITLFSGLFLVCQLSAQDNQFQFRLGTEEQAIGIEQPFYSSTLEDTVTLSVLKFYISNIELFKNQNRIDFDSKAYLLDFDDTSSLGINLVALDFDSIQFDIGLDSLTNISGVFGGDLDPMYGMYWTWKNGYINVKLEGRASKCPARKNYFQYHFGGYQKPYASIQKVAFPISDKNLNNQILVNINLEKYFSQLNILDDYHIMSPSEKSLELSQYFAQSFEIR